MDLGTAQTLAATSGGNDLGGLQKAIAGGNPAASRKAAQQFGALLMENLLREGDGTALPMAGGTGGDIVNQMFTSTMSKAVMSHEKMGLTDMLLRSMQKKQQQADAATSGDATATTTAPKVAAAGTGFSLAAYWQNNGRRPLAAAMMQNNAAAQLLAGGLSMALMTHMNPKLAAAFGAGNSQATVAAQPVTTATTFESKHGHVSGGASAEDMAAFAQKLMPLLRQAGQQLGVSPKILLAQTAIETGWGRSVVGNNLFGIKAGSSWTGPKVDSATHEYQDGALVSITDAFRAYPSAEASVQDLVALVANSPRYRAALNMGDNAAGYAQGLISGGWATDINYVTKLQSVVASPALNNAIGNTAAGSIAVGASQSPAASAASIPAPAPAPPPVAAPVATNAAGVGQPISLLPPSFTVGSR